MESIKGTLKESLKEWDDWDIAEYKLGIALGLFEEDNGSYDFFRENKFIFWSKHPIGEFLQNTIRQMVELEILEFDYDEQKYRWNTNK